MFLVPTAELTLSDIKVYRAQAKEALIKRAQQLGLVTSAEELVIRDFLPNTDVATIPAVNWWITGALVANTLYIYVNALVPPNNLIAFYKVCIESTNPAVARILFQRGTNGATTIGILEVEPLYTKEETEGYLSEPAVYDKSERVYIQILPRAASAGERVIFGAFIAEPVGNTVS